MIKFVRSFLVLSLIFAFSVIGASAQVDGGELEDGEEVEVELDGDETLTFTYNGSEGDAVTIVVNANDGTDTRMTLFDEDGDEVATDDDSGEGTNPALIRVQLPEDGEYSIVIEHYSDGEEIEDEFEVTLFEVDVLDLDSGAQTVELGDDFQVDRMVFEAEEDARYYIFINADDFIEGTVYIDILEEGDTFASTRFSLAGTDGGAIVFEASDDGMVVVELDFYSFGGSNDFTVEVQAED
ncbi:MAG: hypothetical protein Phog2KO_45920 [Phototrophicaceae bacterium]